MEEKEDNTQDKVDDSPRMKKMMKGFFNNDIKQDFKGMKDDAIKGLKRSGAVLIAVAFGWIFFI